MINSPKDTLKVQLSHQFSTEKSFSLEVDVAIPNKGVCALFGPSGSGKTTLLRCIAGLEKSKEANISLNEEIWQNNSVNLPTHKRPIGYVFQEASLFPHLNAEENLQFAIKRANKSQQVISYQDVIKLMAIGPILSRYPEQLSGGERQRIAIARALLIQPKILLMDEPLAALDERLKQEILPYLEQLCHHANIPIIYVSHSLDEVIRLADHMVVLDEGKVIEQGEIHSLLGNLDSSFSKYQEASTIVSGIVEQQDEQWGLSYLRFDKQQIIFKRGNETLGERVRLRIQSKDVSLSLSEHYDSSILNRIQVIVDDLQKDQTDPNMIMVRLLAGNTPILARITALSAHTLQLKKGLAVIAQIKSVAVMR